MDMLTNSGFICWLENCFVSKGGSLKYISVALILKILSPINIWLNRIWNWSSWLLCPLSKPGVQHLVRFQPLPCKHSDSRRAHPGLCSHRTCISSDSQFNADHNFLKVGNLFVWAFLPDELVGVGRLLEQLLDQGLHLGLHGLPQTQQHLCTGLATSTAHLTMF